MTDELAEAILDAIPGRPELARAARVTTYYPRYDGGTQVTGVGRLTVQVGDEQMPCAWLRSLDESARAGEIETGTQVLVVHIDGALAAVDVLRFPAP